MFVPKTLAVAFIVTCLFGSSYQDSKPTDPFYMAAAIEFTPGFKNTDGYLSLLNTAEAKAADIIVFPEATLNRFGTEVLVPAVEDKFSPCGNATYDFLNTLSCKAKEIKKYLVVNLYEKERCTVESQKAKKDPRHCSRTGWSKFNTNVVFDRNGVVIARYRKTHLYGEAGVNVTFTPEIVTFDTDFGVKFGTFICFDMIFETPAQDLVKKHGITDFVYPTYWFSELPFLTALQFQQSWSYANNVNVIASGANLQFTGTSGSGIYNGRNGPIEATINSNAERKIYLAKVPKMNFKSEANLIARIQSAVSETIKTNETPETIEPETREVSGVKSINTIIFAQDDTISQYESEIIQVNKEYYKLCQNKFCCEFNITMENNANNAPNSYVYRAGVFNNKRERFDDGVYVKNCGVFACKDYSLESCGKLYKNVDKVTHDVFTKLVITGVFPKTEKVLVMPNSVDRKLVPIQPSGFEFATHDHDKNNYHVVFKTTKKTEDLLNFGIMANYYSSAPGLYISSLLLTFVSIISIRYL